jgi:hypothetical protein
MGMQCCSSSVVTTQGSLLMMRIRIWLKKCSSS